VSHQRLSYPKICQVPGLQTKVISIDSKGLPSLPPQRNLARFIAGFGILNLGSESKKGSADAEPFLLTRKIPAIRSSNSTDP
jgi:hypothetical protein